MTNALRLSPRPRFIRGPLTTKTTAFRKWPMWSLGLPIITTPLGPPSSFPNLSLRFASVLPEPGPLFGSHFLTSFTGRHRGYQFSRTLFFYFFISLQIPTTNTFLPRHDTSMMTWCLLAPVSKN